MLHEAIIVQWVIILVVVQAGRPPAAPHVEDLLLPGSCVHSRCTSEKTLLACTYNGA